MLINDYYSSPLKLYLNLINYIYFFDFKFILLNRIKYYYIYKWMRYHFIFNQYQRYSGSIRM